MSGQGELNVLYGIQMSGQGEQNVLYGLLINGRGEQMCCTEGSRDEQTQTHMWMANHEGPGGRAPDGGGPMS